jgi:hypothetical protein
MGRLANHATAAVATRSIEWSGLKQREAFEYGPAPLLLSGGFNAAKTTGACLKLLYLMDAFPGSRWVVARCQWEDLKRTTLPTFFKLCPPQMYNRGRRADSEKVLQLNNGSEILWMHLDDPETENVIKGLEINGFLLDQAEDIREEIFDLLMSRLGRWDKALVPQWLLQREQSAGRPWHWFSPDGVTPIPPTYPLLTCNPDIEIHWLYRRFHSDSKEWRETYRKLGYKMITMTVWDNKFATQQNKQEIMNKDISFRRRYGDGEWGIPEGQIHTIPPESMVEPTPDLLNWIRLTCQLYRVLDHGDSSPTACGWFGVDPSGNVFVFREYYRPNALISQHRKAITDLSEGEQYRSNLADPQIFLKTAQKSGEKWSVSDEYADCRALPRETRLLWNPADNSEMSTRNRINEYLQVDPLRIHPITHQPGSPRLFFVKRTDTYPHGCDEILRDTRSQRRVKIGTDLGRPVFCDERDPAVRDHGYDVLRYLIASRPPIAPLALQSRKSSRSTFNAVFQRHLRYVNSSAFKSMGLRARHAALHGGVNVR